MGALGGGDSQHILVEELQDFDVIAVEIANLWRWRLQTHQDGKQKEARNKTIKRCDRDT